MSEEKNILFLIPHLGRGGAERSVSIVSRHLEEKVSSVYLCVFQNMEEIYYEYGGELIELDKGSTKGKIGRWIQRYKRLKQFKKDKNITHTISFLEGANYLNILTKTGDKTIISIRGSKQYDREITGKSGWLRKKILIPWIFPKADLVVPVTQTMALEMEKYFNVPMNKQQVIPNFYDFEQLMQKATADIEPALEKVMNDKFTIISSGRLHMQKYFEELIDVFGQFRKTHDCQLIILGNGDLKETLIKKAKSHSLNVYDWEEQQNPEPGKDVYFIGHQSNPFSIIKKADLFVMMSGWEGFPNALSEAMIIGTPVISSDCPTGPRDLICPDKEPGFGITRYIESDYGYLMPLYDGSKNIAAQYKEVLSAIMANPETSKAKAESATKRMISFKIENVLNMWFDILK